MKKSHASREMKLTRKQQKLWETFIFLVKVILLSVPLYFVILFGISLTPLQIFDATAASGVLRLMGFPVEQNGALVSAGEPPFTFYLTEDCTAWKSFLFLFALIFSVPAVKLGRRLEGLGLGIPLLWIGNQARVVSVVLTERVTNVQFAMFTHDYLWRYLIVFFVLGVWLSWIKYPSFYQKTFQVKASYHAKRHAPRPRLITKKTKR